MLWLKCWLFCMCFCVDSFLPHSVQAFCATFWIIYRWWFLHVKVHFSPVGTEFLCFTGVFGVPGVLDGRSHVVSGKTRAKSSHFLSITSSAFFCWEVMLNKRHISNNLMHSALTVAISDIHTDTNQSSQKPVSVTIDRDLLKTCFEQVSVNSP